MRIAFILNEINPNRTPSIAGLAERPDCDVLVVYESRSEANRNWTHDTDALPYDHVVMSTRALDLRRLGTDAYIHLSVPPLRTLASFAPDVVIGAGGGVWSSPANVAALAGRRRWGWAFVPWWGSFQKSRPTRARRLLEPWVRKFVRDSDACIAYGTRAKGELERLGVDPTRIALVPNAARRGSPSAAGNRRPRDRPVRYLFAGQLIERKGIRPLLEAFTSLEAGELWIAGDGPLRGEVQAAADVDPRIRLLGHADWSKLQDLYRAADALVLPSLYEVWGLVVNEAMEHGLPVVVTTQVGAGDDLVKQGVTGLVVEAGVADELRQALATIAGWPDAKWRRCSEAARARIGRWTVGDAARGLYAACRLAIEQRGAHRPAQFELERSHKEAEGCARGGSLDD